MKHFKHLAALLLVAVLGFSACSDTTDLENQITKLEEQLKAFQNGALSDKDLKDLQTQLEALVNTNSNEIDALMKTFGYTGIENGHFYVDLGLTSGNLWAACNIGANVPTNYGDYYAWGMTTTQETFFPEDYKQKNYNSTDKLTELELEDDVAATLWKGNWRMPSKADFEELQNECNWVWNASKHGYEVRSKKNSNTIFLPAAGYHNNYRPVYAISDWGTDSQSVQGYYWSRTLMDNQKNTAYCFWFSTTKYCKIDNVERYRGNTIRPVISKAK